MTYRGRPGAEHRALVSRRRFPQENAIPLLEHPSRHLTDEAWGPRRSEPFSVDVAAWSDDEFFVEWQLEPAPEASPEQDQPH